MVATDIDLGKFFGAESGVRVPVHYDYAMTRITPEYNPLDPDVKLSDAIDSYDSKSEKDSIRNLVIDNTTRQNLNLMNVRKDRVGGNNKIRVYDIENFDVSFAYTQDKHHDIDFEYDNLNQYRGGLGYNYNPKPKNYKPFSKSKAFSSKHLKLIKDFNFYLLPKTFTFRTDMDRTITKMLYRDKSLGDIIIKPTVDRQWNWTRDYNIKYDFSKALTFDFVAGANAYIDEPIIYPDKNTEEWEKYKDTVWNSILSGGSLRNYNQTLKVTYNVPFSKIPLLDWVTASASYQALYKWSASATSLHGKTG